MMFSKEGVVSKSKQSKMFDSPSHDKMTTGHYNKAGSDHGVGIAGRVGSEKASAREVIPTKSKCVKYEDFDE